MPRNPDYQFVPTDAGEIVMELVAAYEAITGETVLPASPEMLFIRWVAAVIIQERVLTNYAGNQNIPSRAEGENLDALAELTYSKARPKARAATCTMRFSISEAQKTSILIPAGTRISNASNTLIWATLKDNYIPIGETSIEVKDVTCQTPGVVGNGYTPGQISKLVDVYDYYASCENTTTSGGGSNAPDDDEYYELIRSSMDAYSTAGAAGSYIYWAMQTSTEITDVVATSPGPGLVNIYVLMSGGELAGEEMKARVLTECSADNRRPMTDFVSAEDAELVKYDISFTYYLQNGGGKSAADVAAAVNEAVERYKAWQCAKLGRDISPDELREYLYHTGIKRIALSSPEYVHLRDGKDGRAPQVARIGTVTIVNGGYENE